MNIAYLTKPGIKACDYVSDISDHVFFDVDNVKNTPDLILSIGGDGALLRAAQYALKYEIPLYAIHAGNWGVLTSGDKKRFKQDLEYIRQNEGSLYKHFVLEVNIGEKMFFAVNELVCKANTQAVQLIDMQVQTYEHPAYALRGDGLILATPLGSTAYSVSAGGPVLDLDQKSYLSVPLSSQSLQQRPFVIAGNKTTNVYTREDVVIVIDGHIVEHNTNFQCKISERFLQLYNLNNELFLQRFFERSKL